MKVDIKTAADRLKQMDNVVILIHQFPDGDTIGCGYSLCLALQKLGKKARVECCHEVGDRYDYITDCVKFDEFETKNVVAVDVADLNLLGEISQKYKDHVDLCIDHHATNGLYAKETLVDSTAAAACEIIYEIICDLIGDVDKNMATALYTGISTDTGCFMFTNTTPKTHVIAAKLMEKGVDYGEINRIMFDTKTKSRIMIEKECMDSIVYSCNDQVALMTITKDMRTRAGANDAELEGITGLPRKIEGVILGITIRERDDTSICKVSARTHAPISAAEFCSAFGGGGHERAAGCSINAPVEEAKKLLLQEAEKAIKKAGL